jgi:hypothetical protein
MYASVQQALRAVFDDLGLSLVPEATRGRLLAFAARHPGFGQTQYLECRLGRRVPPQVDLLVSAATTFERANLRRLLAARAAATPELWAIRRFTEAWGSPASPLHRSVPVAWLEFDHMERDPEPIASVGICLAPAYLDPFAALPPQPPQQVLATILDSLRAIRRHEASAEEVGCFERCLDRLPPGASWIHLSVMAGRAPVELKLYGVFPADAVVPHLAAIGWAGDPAAVAGMLARYCPAERTGGAVYLDLPVTGMLSPARAGAGVVFAQQQLRIAGEHDPARAALLDQLVADGLCDAEERDELRRWPGHAVRALADAEPAHPAAEAVSPAAEAVSPAAEAVSPAAEAVSIDRWFDIKLAHRTRERLLAKAYLGFAARDAAAAIRRPAGPGYPRRAASPAPTPAPETI